jgi:aryl-alcohol dehydrogenase-like predicted oxidoreductase
LLTRSIEAEILPACRQLGIGVTAYGVLSRGLISGHWSAQRGEQGRDFRRMNPRFSGDNLTHNLGLVEKLRGIAGRKGCSVAQLAIAWVLAQGADIIPLVGARRRERLDESLAALDVILSDMDLAELARAIPRDAAAGARYAPAQMVMLDSEKATVRA